MEKTTVPARSEPKLIWETPHFRVFVGILDPMEGLQPEFRPCYVVADKQHGILVGSFRTEARARLCAVESEGEFIAGQRMCEEVEARNFVPLPDGPTKGKNGH